MPTNTTAQITDTVATFLLDSDLYVERGAAHFDGTPQEWADAFRALGGTYASIEPSWRTGAPSVALTAAGTDEAVAFARDTYAVISPVAAPVAA